MRYPRKKLLLASHRGGVERDSWDMSSSKTPSLGRQFLKSRRIICFGQGRVIYAGGSGKGEILRTKTSDPKASVGRTIFKEQNKIPLPEKGGKNWQREGGKKEVIPDNMTPHH